MEEEFIATSLLEFVDRFEGQVFERGTKQACEKLMNLIDAIAYNGGEKVLSSSIQVLPVSAFDIDKGQLWRMEK